MQDLIAELRAARLAQRLTQQEVADAAGLPRKTVSDMECGVCVPLLSTFVAIAYVLGLRAVLVPVRADHDVEGLLSALVAERFPDEEKA